MSAISWIVFPKCANKAPQVECLVKADFRWLLERPNHWNSTVQDLSQFSCVFPKVSNSLDNIQNTTLACVLWFYSPQDVMDAHPTPEIRRWHIWPSLQMIMWECWWSSMWSRYVDTMAAQELCSSNHQDIIDAATLEGVFSCWHIWEDDQIFIWTGPAYVTTIMNDNLQQSAVVAYFCR